MAKINKFLIEYKDRIEFADITNGTTIPKAVIKRFVRIFEDVEDTRCQGMIDYPLSEIILITFIAVLANSSTWYEIERFGLAKEEWFRKFLKLENGIPSHDTFRRVFSLIDTESLEKATVSFLVANLAAIKKTLGIKDDGIRHIAIDGKEQCGTGRLYNTDNEVKNLQTLHVYDVSNGITIASRPIDKKTNEIPVAREILNTMDLKGCIVTFDALHTQKETVKVIVERGGLYVGGLKGNQQGLFEEASALFTDKLKKSKRKNDLYFETIEKAHGQVETRTYYMIRKPKESFNGNEDSNPWTNLNSIICYDKTTENINTGKISSETRYYISNLKCSDDNLELAADAIRGHWSIENNLHWLLDSAFYEDDNSTMDKKAFNNLSIINKMVLSLCKLGKEAVGSPSIRVLRKEFGWNFDLTMARFFSAFDVTSIIEALDKCHK